MVAGPSTPSCLHTAPQHAAVDISRAIAGCKLSKQPTSHTTRCNQWPKAFKKNWDVYVDGLINFSHSRYAIIATNVKAIQDLYSLQLDIPFPRLPRPLSPPFCGLVFFFPTSLSPLHQNLTFHDWNTFDQKYQNLSCMDLLIQKLNLLWILYPL